MMLSDLRRAPTKSVFVTRLTQVYARPLVAAISTVHHVFVLLFHSWKHAARRQSSGPAEKAW